MKNEDIRIKRVIQRCGCDAILPLALVYIFYIILHGHLSPGGGFQGGVLMVATLLLIYLGHGYAITYQAMRPRLLRKVEGLALAAYILLALLGVALGSSVKTCSTSSDSRESCSARAPSSSWVRWWVSKSWRESAPW